MIINMPVEVVGEFCANCPELDLDIFTKENYVLDSKKDGETNLKDVTCQNILKCKYCARCKTLFDLKEKAEKKPAPVKRTSKSKKEPAPKKTTGKATAKK